jgi:hypothetical protein
MPNGLQVRGREEVRLLATGVSASLGLFEEAAARLLPAITCGILRVSLASESTLIERGSPGGWWSIPEASE